MAIDKHDAANTALKLLDDEGLEKLTVRRLATELGVRAPALYWHFDGKRALLDHVTDAMLTPAARALDHPGPAEPWWEWLERTAQTLRAGLLAHRDGARVASGADLRRARALGAFAERATEVLHDAGFGLGDASRAAGALIHFVIGRIVEDQSRPDPETERELLAGGDLPYPALRRAMIERAADGSTPDTDFAYSLGIMITGLRALHGGNLT